MDTNDTLMEKEALLEELSKSFISGEKQDNTNIAKALYDWLKYLIVTGKLPAGFRFPNEVRFCKMLGVSRGLLREVYSRLEQVHLISKSKGGTFVSEEGDVKAGFDLLPSMDAKDMRELVELRSMLEIGAAKLAAQNATTKDIEMMEIQVGMIERYSNNLALTTYYDSAFHYCILNATHNELLIRLFNELRPMIDTSLWQLYNKHSEIVMNAVDSHRLILDAIIKRDAELATQIVSRHMLGVEALL